ncbi:MAG TPA: hypothetical protein VGH67_14490 [Solirubrobacteraceae bacterium]|jgi:hypothetical protein
MRRALLAITAIAALSVPVIASAAGKRHVHFTSKAVGAGISANHSAYQVHDSHFGNGAGVQTVKVKGSGGTDTEISYYGNATTRSKGTFTLGTPDANGIATLTGSGHDVSGTGKAAGLKSTYTYTGTFNTKTGIFNVTLTGTYTF